MTKLKLSVSVQLCSSAAAFLSEKYTVKRNDKMHENCLFRLFGCVDVVLDFIWRGKHICEENDVEKNLKCNIRVINLAPVREKVNFPYTQCVLSVSLIYSIEEKNFFWMTQLTGWIEIQKKLTRARDYKTKKKFFVFQITTKRRLLLQNSIMHWVFAFGYLFGFFVFRFHLAHILDAP